MYKKIFAALAIIVLVGIGLALAFPDDLARWLISAERDRAGLTYKTTDVDGATWHYLEGGPADGETIVMLHGFSANKDNWTRFAAHFTDDYHVVAPDLPGFGQSERHRDWNYALPNQNKRLQGFVEALRLESFHLVGNSMGGFLTALYAHSHADRVITAGLFNNAGINAPEPSEMAKAVADGRNPLLVESVEDFDRVLAFTTEKTPVIPWPVKPFIARRAVAQREFNAFIFGQYLADRSTGLESLLPDLTLPVLVLWGRDDRVLDKSAVDVMVPLLPNETVVIMDDTGHLPMIERPAETAAHYRAFLEGADTN